MRRLAAALASVCFALTPTHYLVEWYCAPSDPWWDTYHRGDETSRLCVRVETLPAGEFDCRIWDSWSGPVGPGEVWYRSDA